MIWLIYLLYIECLVNESIKKGFQINPIIRHKQGHYENTFQLLLNYYVTDCNMNTFLFNVIFISISNMSKALKILDHQFHQNHHMKRR